MEQQRAESEEQERQVRFISDAATSLSELVNDLLDLAKAQAGKVVVHPVEFDVGNLFGALRGMLRPLLLNESVSLVFEEPENGLHPFRLQMVLDILRKMSRGEVGTRQRQIVITTHNPLLLNYASPEEVRVFVRHPEEGTQVIPMTKVPDLDRLLKEFALGELWYLLGEEKLFQEQPA